nr:universal stress protein [Methylonatrum kenyense]
MTGEAHTIVVPVDGSEHSDRAIDVAAQLSQSFGAGVQLLHVMPAGPAEFSDIPGNRSVASDGDLAAKRSAAEQVIQRAKNHLAEKLTCKVETRVLEDPEHQHDPANAIIQEVDANPGAIVVMGSRGLGGIGRFLLGSVGDAVVHKAHPPVTLVHADEHPANTGEFKQILVPVDGSEHSLRATRLAGDIARSNNIPVQLVFCREGDATGSFPALIESQESLGEVPAGVSTRELSGAPETVLLDYVNDQAQPTLVIMGRRGMSGWQEALLGSISRNLLSKACCPVMVVR